MITGYVIVRSYVRPFAIVRVFITDLVKHRKSKPSHTYSALKPPVFVPSNAKERLYFENLKNNRFCLANK